MTSMTLKRLLFSMLVLLLGGCATIPTGPSVMVYPGTGKGFDQFRYDNMTCRHYALEWVGGTSPSQNATQSVIASAVTATAIGAAAGALLGGNEGAAIGAGMGLLVGTMVGSETGQTSAYDTQQPYDNAYIQCMYANGHLVPLSGQLETNAYRSPGATHPPPPPGMPPPPPPGM